MLVSITPLTANLLKIWDRNCLLLRPLAADQIEFDTYCRIESVCFFCFSGNSLTISIIKNRAIKIVIIVLSGFEPLSRAPKARRIDHYPTGLHIQAFTYSLIHVLNFCASSELFCGIFRPNINLYIKSYTSFETFYMTIFFV